MYLHTELWAKKVGRQLFCNKERFSLFERVTLQFFKGIWFIFLIYNFSFDFCVIQLFKSAMPSSLKDIQ